MFTLMTMDHQGLPVQPIRKAFEQVASQLRELLVQGVLQPGDRLPNELELAERFGVSRGTVREALRTLATEGLIITTRGASGGSFAAIPDPASVVQSLTGTLTLMAAAREVTVAELLEVRELLEVPAARMAALKRTDEDLGGLRGSIPSSTVARVAAASFDANRGFHEQVLAAAGNRLLRVTTEPLFVTLQVRFLRHHAPPEFWEQVRTDHEDILEKIERGDGEAAAGAMAQHLANIRPTYEAIDAARAHPRSST
jgi:GntR family transcriptional regulator, transcriptional repressor for pyruvate dehydrogenase complex